MFLIEGKKLLQEAIESSWNIAGILVREDITAWWEENYPTYEAWEIDKERFKQLSQQQQSEGVLAVINFPTEEFCQSKSLDQVPAERAFILHAIQDPGNLGTIMRSLDWLGISHLILGPGCVDPLNLKALRSSMGAIFRMHIHVITDIEGLVERNVERIYLADMEGEPLQKSRFPADAWILVGNEANGIPEFLQEKGLKKVSIPKIGQGESLNAAVSAALIAWEMMRLEL